MNAPCVEITRILNGYVIRWMQVEAMHPKWYEQHCANWQEVAEWIVSHPQ